jgi:hypothetical protein
MEGAHEANAERLPRRRFALPLAGKCSILRPRGTQIARVGALAALLIEARYDEQHGSLLEERHHDDPANRR